MRTRAADRDFRYVNTGHFVFRLYCPAPSASFIQVPFAINVPTFSDDGVSSEVMTGSGSVCSPCAVNWAMSSKCWNSASSWLRPKASTSPASATARRIQLITVRHPACACERIRALPLRPRVTVTDVAMRPTFSVARESTWARRHARWSRRDVNDEVDHGCNSGESITGLSRRRPRFESRPPRQPSSRWSSTPKARSH